MSDEFRYIFLLIATVNAVLFIEKKSASKFFDYLPAVVIIYVLSMLFAYFGLFEQSKHLDQLSSDIKTYLLPAMLFLMLLQVDLKDFTKLGKKLLVSYILAVSSIAFSFVAVVYFFAQSADMAGAFGALLGSWTGGMANMVAVATALEVSKEAFGFALVADSINYTIWISLLLFMVPFARRFNMLVGATSLDQIKISVSCEDSKKHYLFLLILSVFVASVAVFLSSLGFVIFNQTTTAIIIATFIGIFASTTRLSRVGGSARIGSLMLYFLIAIIGSGAVFETLNGVGVYVAMAFGILLLHALIMLVGAKLFRLDLFSIAVASLANIGGVASASILAAAYDKKLVGVGVLMAVMGFLIGTFVGIGVGGFLMKIVEVAK